MRATSVKNFLAAPESVLEAVETEPVTLVRDEGNNLVLMRESDWRSLQETVYLLSAPLNASRLAESLAQTRTPLAPWGPTPDAGDLPAA